MFIIRSNVVFLVHGFYPSLWKDPVAWLWDFYDIKDRIIEDDENSDNNTVVIIVNWTKGSEIHFGLFLKDVLEGIIGKITNTMRNFAPIISQIVKDLTSLGDYN